MKTLKRLVPIILLILFEIMAGVLLLINPEAFTTAIIIIFGVVCAVIGLIYLIKYLRARKRGEESALTLIGACFALALGLFSAIASPMIVKMFTFIAVVYAVIMIVTGIIKIQNYIINRRMRRYVPAITLLSAMIAIVLGVVILFNPFETTQLLWMVTGISILVEAAIDVTTLIVALVSEAHPIDDGEARNIEVLD